jgi:hypothetical protein
MRRFHAVGPVLCTDGPVYVNGARRPSMTCVEGLFGRRPFLWAFRLMAYADGRLKAVDIGIGHRHLDAFL